MNENRTQYEAMSLLGRLKRLQGGELPWSPAAVNQALASWVDSTSLRFSADQANALATMTSLPVSMLSGDPGSGSTTLARFFIEAVKASDPQLPIAVCAPTGKAAKRLTDALSTEVVTVQKLMQGPAGLDRFKTDFETRFNNPLPCKLLVIFTVEMMPAETLRLLVESVAVGTAVLLVGKVSGDQIEEPTSAMPYLLNQLGDAAVRLTTVHRQQDPQVPRADSKGAFLLRFKQKDGPLGVTRATLTQAAHDLGMNETELIHVAVRTYIRENIPAYDVKSQLSDEQMVQVLEEIRKRVPQNPEGRVLSALPGVE